MKTTQTGKPILDALLNASESLDNKTPESDNQRNETCEISEERKKVLCGLGQAKTPQERAFQSAFIKACGYDRWPVSQSKPVDDNDYEGAILAKQEKDYI